MTKIQHHCLSSCSSYTNSGFLQYHNRKVAGRLGAPFPGHDAINSRCASVACLAAVDTAFDDCLVFTPSRVVQVQVTRLVEQRMLQQPNRAAAYRQYQQSTAMWFPGRGTLQTRLHVA